MGMTNRYRNLSTSSKRVFWVILAVMVVVGLIAFFTSETGRNATLLCCGGVVVLVVVGILSESGMRRG
jgi:cell division protein FtsW (lipid II flippase)